MNFDRRTFLTSTAAAAVMVSLPGRALAQAAGQPAPQGDAARAATIYQDIAQRVVQATPEIATSLGLDAGPLAALKGRLSDASPAGRTVAAQVMIDAIPQLRQLDRAQLSARQKGWLDTAIWTTERVKANVALPYGGNSGFGYPVPYAISQLTGSYQSVPDFLDSQHNINTAADAEAYLSRLEAFAANVGHEVDQVEADAGHGVIAPVSIIDKTLTQTRNLRDDGGAQAGLVRSLVRRTGEKNIAGDWERRATAIVDGALAAALDRQIALLTGLRGRASEAVGVGRLPGGAEFYQAALRFHTSTSLTADEAHEIGLEQVRQISAEADVLLRRENLTQGSVGARISALGQQERFLYPNSDAGRAEIIADLNRHMAALRARMPEMFSASTIPTAGMEIRRVPPAIEAGAPRGYAQGGTLDGSRPGAFYINLVNTSIWPKWSLPTLNHHESVPGHLWQGAIVLAQQDIPLLLRANGIPAFGEGWGLYAEQLADEMGVYEGNALNRLGMLQSFLYRAARIVMDTGMHSKGWARDRTIQYFIDTVGLDPISATSEVERYVVWPGQATSYKIGHNEMLRIRADARQRLGARFDLKAFHDLVLLSGDMPLEVLAGMAREWDGGRVV